MPPRPQQPIGNFARFFLDRHGRRNDPHCRVFNRALTELAQCHRGESAVNCLAKLLEHLQEIHACDASIAFLVGGKSPVTNLVLRKESTVVLPSEALTRSVQQKVERSWCKTEVGRPIEFSKDDLVKLLGGSFSEFDNCIVVKGNVLPGLGDADQAVLVCFFGKNRPQLPLDRTFLRDLLDMLLAFWSHAFSQTRQAFDHTIELVSSRRAQNDPRVAALKRACLAQAWLTKADVYNACESVLESTSDPTDAEIRNLQKQMGLFREAWHCCPDRPWPCDRGAGRRLAALEWFSWRLPRKARASPATGARNLQEAIRQSRDTIRAELGELSGSVALEKVLDKTALYQVLLTLGQAAEAGEPGASRFRLPQESTEAHENAKHHLGRFAAAVLSEVPPTAECVEGMIWTVSEYAYQVLGVARQLHLGSHLRHSARAEPSLHSMREFYRDHFFHTMEVCFLGHLLSLARPDGPGESSSAFPSNTHWLREWYIAALLHDIGRAVDICKGLEDWLGFFASSSFAELAKGIGKAMETAADSDKFREFCVDNGFKPELKPWEDHGLVGAYHVHTLASDVNGKTPIHATDRAVHAIAKHHCDRITVRYTQEPLSALLILCDLLQVWCRPQFRHFSTAPASMLSLMAGSAPSFTPPEAMPASLLTNLRFVGEPGDGEDLVPRFTPPLVLRLVYGPDVSHDSCVFHIWLDATRQLQRVDFSALPFDVLVQIVTPTYVPPRENAPRKQMDRLFDAARETHMGYLENWFPRRVEAGIYEASQAPPSCCTANRVCYHAQFKSGGGDGRPDGQPIEELVSFNLRRMNGVQDLMTEELARFREDLRRWRKYHEDRLLTGDYSPWRHSSEYES